MKSAAEEFFSHAQELRRAVISEGRIQRVRPFMALKRI